MPNLVPGRAVVHVGLTTARINECGKRAVFRNERDIHMHAIGRPSAASLTWQKKQEKMRRRSARSALPLILGDHCTHILIPHHSHVVAVSKVNGSRYSIRVCQGWFCEDPRTRTFRKSRRGTPTAFPIRIGGACRDRRDGRVAVRGINRRQQQQQQQLQLAVFAY